MTEEKQAAITKLVNDSLDQAEAVWGKVGAQVLLNASGSMILNESVRASVPTTIPGYDVLEDGKPLVDEFIALVLDMRDSSHHLNCALSGAKAQTLERVFYEIAALLPACSQVIAEQKGGVTEYLGDGLLAFFRVDKDNRAPSCYRAYNAAVGCLDIISNIINPILKNRYRLPALSIGIGMSISNAVLTITGQANFVKPVAFGKCVFYASKLSKGTGEICIDKALKTVWPEGEEGTLIFRSRTMGDIAGYVVYDQA